MPSRAAERINFGKIKEVIAPPNLIEIQITSYREFLQAEVATSKRKNLGLQAVFTEVFPIESYDGKVVLDYHSYEIGEPKQDWLECLREGITYGAPLHVTFLLKDEGGTKEEKVFMGELPLMTPQGTFVINGAERVIVSQLHRSPGIAFEATQHPNGKTLHSFRIIPDRGSWYEAQFDTSDLLYVYLDRKKRRRKFLTTTFFRALGYGSDADILKLFYDIEELTVKEAEKLEDIQNKVLVEDAMDSDKGIVVARAFEPLSKAVVKQIAELGVTKIKVVDTTVDDGIVIKCMKKDPAKNEEEALKDIYRRLRPGEPPTAANARALIKRLFFDPKRYDLGRVGRYKIHQKLGVKNKDDSRILTKEDLVAATKYLLRLKKGEGSLDDIDHLGSRRVRTVGELLANQCRVGLARTERLVKERMTLFDQGVESMSPQKLINPKANSPVGERGSFTTDRVVCRGKGDFIDVEPTRVDYMDVSPKQLVSVAASLIPFLEHDDANRALMGSNMQRQAVPLLVTDAPLVATGLEERVARDSRAVIVAEEAGKVASVNGNQIIITEDGKLPETKKRLKHDPAKGIYVYEVRKFMRSNAATCINQKILVRKGDTIKKGQIIADGPCTQGGELALGRNVLVAFMPWNGYNFEDAILISERIVKEDVFTSIHIDEFEVGARDTKLGPEEITRDIPNLGEEALKNLGPDGVIRVGAEVKPGDILVGKITPKSETELAPEERLLRAIFGEKAADV